MKNKRILVLGLALILLALVVGVAFAADGISLNWRNNTVYVSNSNSTPYDVPVLITYSAYGYSNQTTRTVNVKAGKTESVSIGTSAIIEHVEVIRAGFGL
jgi:hypothetical protein